MSVGAPSSSQPLPLTHQGSGPFYQPRFIAGKRAHDALKS